MTPRDRSTNRLMMNSDQLELVDRSLEQQAIENSNHAASEARRTEYLERLRAALPELRKLEGFPIGSDEDILALSDPPYYTACPNPFLAEFITEHGTAYDEATDDYHREPFAADVSEGKSARDYSVVNYHTKVPPDAITPYIDHYTVPGDVILDSFSGSGMTGVAGQLMARAPKSARAVILNDLSPAATSMSWALLADIDPRHAEYTLTILKRDLRAELGSLYATPDGELQYLVWSDVLTCPACSEEADYWSLAVEPSLKLRSEGKCPSCGASFSLSSATRATESVVDPYLGTDVVRRARETAIKGFYGTRTVRLDRPPGREELDLIRAVATLRLEGVPVAALPKGPNTDQPRASHGINYVHQFYPSRALRVLAFLHHRAMELPMPERQLVLWIVLAMHARASRRNRYIPEYGHRHVGVLSGTLYIPPLREEGNQIRAFDDRAGKAVRALRARARGSRAVAVSTGSATCLSSIGDRTIDYCFVDPPFGANINYSELNYLWEAWLAVETSTRTEAIVNRAQAKGLREYQALMTDSCREIHRALKPGRWMTMVFHNSSNAVWSAIQEAIQRSGLVVADVRTLDKKKGTIKQLSTTNAVMQDLVISAYRPRSGFEKRFTIEAGTEQGAWDFVREHLTQLPVFVEHNGRVEVVAERQNYLLFDRMVAFHIQRGITVPLSAGQFYAGLNQRFIERDDMYFTELQAAEYDRRRLDAPDVEQMSVFVVDEKSAIQWIRAELLARPQTFQDLQPKFLRELNQNRFEALPELRDMLDQGFLEDPLSHQWRVPDPARQADLEGLRQKTLLSEFATYVPGSAKIKRFRIEAVRAGFADLWAKRAYAAIIAMAERLPDEVVQEDPALLMYYDNAVTREGAG